jgi:hypothetical protein
MARTAAKTSDVRHLTEYGLADRYDLDVSTIRTWRKNGTGPKYLKLSESATSGTIRYRLADVEAWEESRLKAATV